MDSNDLNHATTCCIVGGGPAGMMLGYMLARKGVRVTLLEAHADFDRDFRGDTVHPSVLDILDQLGLADELLQLPHGEIRRADVVLGDEVVTVASFAGLPSKYPYVAMIPQVRFLEFMATRSREFSSLSVVMGARVESLIEVDGMVRGVRYRAKDAQHSLFADLVVGADGRFSEVRRLSGLTPISTSAPMDVLWIRLPRYAHDPSNLLLGRASAGQILAQFDRHEYWQLALVIPKGGYSPIHKAGIAALRNRLALLVPEMTDRLDTLTDWKQVGVLSVESDRLTCWHRPGLLLIGDAAHVMSPVGGVGINYAIQDAVACANVLARPLLEGRVTDADLAEVQCRREWPTRWIQLLQSVVQRFVISRALSSNRPLELPSLLRLLLKIPAIQQIPARIIGFGFGRERVEA